MPNPELLSPVGNLEKLPFAIEYGADAVYLAGDRFGLRAGVERKRFILPLIFLPIMRILLFYRIIWSPWPKRRRTLF